MHGTAAGATLGVVTGLVPGALVGEPGMGAAAGAIAGGASGTAYEYDSRRQDRRNKELTAAIAGSQAAATPSETVGETGTRRFTDFLGDWNMSAWAMRGDGTRISGSGKAKATMEARNSVRFSFIDIVAEGDPQDVDGSALISYSDQGGFAMECAFTAYSGTRRYVGEFLPQSNEYHFYPVDASAQTGTTGVTRSNVKIVIRPSGNMIAISTFSMIDGKETEIQSYRLTR